MTAYVYLLAHAKEPRVKIGKAVDVFARAKILGSANFDFERSKAYCVDSDAAALQMERILHLVFDADRLHPKNVCKDFREDGDTEWFSLECIDKAPAFLDSAASFIKYQQVDIESLRPAVQKLDMDRATRRQKKLEEEERKREKRFAKHAKRKQEAAEATEIAISRATQSLNDLCTKAKRVALLPRNGRYYLVLTAAPDDYEEVQELAFNLLDAHFSTSYAGISLFSSSTHVQGLMDGDSGAVVHVNFETRLVPSYTSSMFERFRNLETPVEGWCKDGLTEEAYAWACKVYEAVEGE